MCTRKHSTVQYKYILHYIRFGVQSMQQLYNTLTDYDIRYYLYELLKVSATLPSTRSPRYC